MKRYLILLLLVFASCEREYDAYPNYVYTFSYLNNVDEWGIETWGAHQFVTKTKITNIESFKECYVNYLCWSGLDDGCEVKKVYYADNKHVKIQYMRESFVLSVVPEFNDCIE